MERLDLLLWFGIAIKLRLAVTERGQKEIPQWVYLTGWEVFYLVHLIISLQISYVSNVWWMKLYSTRRAPTPSSCRKSLFMLLHFNNVQTDVRTLAWVLQILIILNIIKHYLHVCCRLQHNLLDSVKVQTIIQAAGCKANTATQPVDSHSSLAAMFPVYMSLCLLAGAGGCLALSVQHYWSSVVSEGDQARIGCR